MKNTSRFIICFFTFLLSTLYCRAQYAQLIPFKNDTQLSDSRGMFTDSASHGFLYKMQEPLLSNYYLGKEIYRFTLAHTLLNTSFLIKIEKTGKGTFVTTKELVNHGKPSGVFDTATGSGNYSSYTLDLNEQAALDPVDYAALRALVDTFFAHPVSPDRMCIDGSEWTLEVSSATGYYIVKKWSPAKGDPLRKIGELMIDLSKLRHKRWVKKL